MSKTTFEKKLVYLKDAIYFLSTSSNMLKFHVDLQESVEKQAVAIELPNVSCDYGYYLKEISLGNREVVFVVSIGEYLRV